MCLYCNIFNVFPSACCVITLKLDGICSFESFALKIVQRHSTGNRTCNVTCQEQNMHYKHVLRFDDSDKNCIPLT